MSQIKVNSIVPLGGLPSGSNGGIIQTKQATLTSKFSTTSTSMVDSGLSVSITPSSSSSKILVHVSLGSLSNAEALKRALMSIVRGSTEFIIGNTATGHEVTAAVCPRSADANHSQIPLSFMVIDSPATTSEITYKVQLSRGSDTGTVYLNGSAGADSAAGNTASTIIVMEVTA